MFVLAYKHEILIQDGINSHRESTDIELEVVTPRGEHLTHSFEISSNGKGISFPQIDGTKSVEQVFNSYISSMQEIKQRNPNAVITVDKFDIVDDTTNEPVRSFIGNNNRLRI